MNDDEMMIEEHTSQKQKVDYIYGFLVYILKRKLSIMNRLIKLFAFLCVSGSLSAQYDTINQPLNLNQWGHSPVFTQAGDIDGDGQLDFIGSSQPFSATAKIGWIKQIGPDQFSYPLELKPDVNMLNFEVADWDGDSDLDIIYVKSGYGNTSRLGWLENMGGVPVNWQDHDIHNDTFPETKQILESGFGDFDDDGDVDAVVTVNATSFEGLMYYENLGGGQSSPPILVSEEAWNAKFLSAEDMNGDGKKDIVYRRFSSIEYIRVGMFGLLSPVEIVSPVIGSENYLKDVNFDGIADFFEFSYGAGISVHLSNGNPSVYPTEIHIDSAGTFPIVVTDLNGDAIMDVAYRTDEGRLAYRLGTSADGTTYGSKVEYDFGRGIGGSLSTADLDFDGLPEIIARVSGSELGVPSILSIFSNEEDNISHVDLLLDGDIKDVAFEHSDSGDYPSVVYSGYCSNGPCFGTLSPYQFRDTSYYLLEAVGGLPILDYDEDLEYRLATCLSDLNNDGRYDAIFNLSFLNTGGMSEAFVALAQDDGFGVAQRVDAYDGHTWDWHSFENNYFGYPIVVKEGFYDSLTVFMNEDDDGIPDFVQSFSFEGERFTNISSIDINGDTYEDLLLSYEEASVIYLIFDPVQGLFLDGVSIEGNATNTLGIIASDVDQDGVLDLVADGRTGVWFAKGLGNNQFDETSRLFFGNTIEPSQLEIADWDQDGDLDILLVRSSEPVFLERDSVSPFAQYRVHEFESIFGDNRAYYSILDYDQDGRNDILTHNSKLSIYNGTEDLLSNIKEVVEAAEPYDVITAFPNPVTNGRLNLNFDLTSTFTASGEIDIYLFDLSGRTVLHTMLNSFENVALSVADLTPGTYVLHAVSGRSLIGSEKILIAE